jgi:hypothetical protein
MESKTLNCYQNIRESTELRRHMPGFALRGSEIYLECNFNRLWSNRAVGNISILHASKPAFYVMIF